MKYAKKIALSLVITFLCGTIPSMAAADVRDFQFVRDYDGRYTDVNPGDWYYDAVTTAYSYGIENEAATDLFCPDEIINAGEAAAYAEKVYLLSKGAEPVIAPDDPFVWYSGYYQSIRCRNMYYSGVQWLPITGRDFVVLLSRLIPEEQLGPLDETITEAPDLQGNPYKDTILLFYQAGIIDNSDTAGTFHATERITRAEAMAIVAKIIDPSLRKVQ